MQRGRDNGRCLFRGQEAYRVAEAQPVGTPFHPAAVISRAGNPGRPAMRPRRRVRRGAPVLLHIQRHRMPLSMTSPRVFRSFFVMCRSLTGTTRWTESAPQSAAMSISSRSALTYVQHSAERPASAISRIASRSPADAAADPASMTLTPIEESFRAISSFSSGSSETPGVCSPSRNVVSKKRRLFTNKTICHGLFHHIRTSPFRYL